MAAKKRRILVIEDEEEYRKLERRVLEKAGYEMLEAATGAEGLALFDAHEPDLILLDVVLPDMLGFDVRRKMRPKPGRKMPPVLFCTVRSAAASLAEGVSLGSADYVLKPFDPADLLTRVADALENAGA